MCGWKVRRIFFRVSSKKIFPFGFCIMICLFFPGSLSPIRPSELVQIAQTLLDTTSTPGLVPLLTKALHDKGAAFELEAALTLLSPNTSIIGFDLDLNFRNKSAFVTIKKNIIELRTTEFDIITPTFAIECKSYKHPSKCDLKQIIKEKTMLAWAKVLAQEIENHQVIFSFEQTKKGTPFVSISSPSTDNISIPLTTSWFTSDEEELCIAQLKDIIKLLAHLSQRVYFKNGASDFLREKFDEENIIIFDDIRFRRSCLKGHCESISE